LLLKFAVTVAAAVWLLPGVSGFSIVCIQKSCLEGANIMISAIAVSCHQKIT